MKICKWCNKEKPLTDFYSENKKKVDGTPYIYYHPECKECTKDSATKWRKKPENREKFLENRKRMNSKPKQKALVKKRSQKFREIGYYKKWQDENKDKIQLYNQFRNMHKKHDITEEEWYICKEYFNFECAYCGMNEIDHLILYNQQLHKDHVDHEGSNDITNCVPACKVCNSSKKTNTIEEWYNSNNSTYSEERIHKIFNWLFIDVYNF